MALSLHSHLNKTSLIVRLLSSIQSGTLISVQDSDLILCNNALSPEVSYACSKTSLISVQDSDLILCNNALRPEVSYACSKTSHFRLFGSVTQSDFCEDSSSADLLMKLDNALKDHHVDEVWKTFNEFKNSYGLPESSLVSRLITELSYSSNSHWLRKAMNLVLLLQKGKSNILRSEFLIKLSLSLARAQMPVPASMILRLMLEKEIVPPNDIFCSIIMHMVKTDTGTYLTSNILNEICDSIFQRLKGNKKPTCARLIKPDTKIFNLVLNACVKFESSLKGQLLIELMSQVGVIADAQTIVIIAQIHEMNGQRDELKKLKVHVDQAPFRLTRHYQQFYDCLLSLHCKYNDIDAASALVLYMYRYKQSPSYQTDRREQQNPCFISIGSQNLKTVLKLQIMPELLNTDCVLVKSYKHELINYRNGKLVLGKRGLAKIISVYKKGGKIDALSKLLISIEKEETGFCLDVAEACVHLGWLENAHDILEDMELAGISTNSSAYMALLKAYNKRQMFREEKALLNQLKNNGFNINVSDEVSDSIEKSDIAEFLVREMHKEEKAVPYVVYEFNSSLYFFCKAKMIEDAQNTYRKMQEAKVQPTVQTFAILVQGYSSLGMYREITILWGDIKRNIKSRSLDKSRDLFEFLLLNFIRGGYFERVMEVIGYMKDADFFTDKWMYRRELLKFHRDLYRNLVASEAITEAQSRRLEFVRAFRKWVGVD